jgi:prepilin-type processing-associated H-X9-DG protein/prepilin-type N-terminal cleavage/methylation domain-containing protein
MARKGFSLLELLIVILLLVFSYFIGKYLFDRAIGSSAGMCRRKIKFLYSELVHYALEHDKRYPPPEKWCDSLLENGGAMLPDFYCSDGNDPKYVEITDPNHMRNAPVKSVLDSEYDAEDGQHIYVYRAAWSHFAINPNAEPNSPANVVLLFSTKGGWNQSGGPELLTFDNHRGRGANVLFNDGHVEFVKPEDAGKLKWKAEDANKVKSRGANNEIKN